MVERRWRLGRALDRLSLRARLTGLLAILAVFLLAILAVQLAYLARLSDQHDDVVHRVGLAVEVTSGLRAAVTDLDRGVRGYVLTGDERLLEPYDARREAAGEALRRLDTLVGDSPTLAADLDRVRSALSRWRRLAAEPALDSTAQDDTAAAEELVQGGVRFDTLQDAIDVLADRIEDERTAEIEDIDDTYDTLRTVMFLQVGGLVVLGAAIAVTLSRQVLSPLARLGREARLVAAGDLDRSVRGEGPPELVRIGEDVEAMRARIVDELQELTAIRAELEDQAAELARSNADLEQFAYVASHDLQEPLRKVSGFCQLLERRYGDQLDDRAREYIRFAADGAQRMQLLINELLAFSRVGRSTGGFQPVDLADVAADAVEALDEPITAAGTTVTVGDLPVVPCDPRLLGVVFQNLIGNAVKFRSDEPPRVEVTATCQDDEWTIKVADNGIGVDDLYADRIFALFGRLHHRTDYEGTGIGLALSKKIVEFHGGRIWLEPIDQRGATFAFTLPSRSRGAVPPTRSETDDDPERTRRHPTDRGAPGRGRRG